MLSKDREAAVTAWSEADRSHAVLTADRAIVDISASVRSLIVELAAARPEEEFYDACAVLGRLIADRGGSPTLAALTIDHACKALGTPDAPWAGSARAAVAEGFALGLTEGIRRSAMEAWEYPHCVIPLGEGSVAIAAGHPSDDDEIVDAWAARVARAVALKGCRRAVVAGGEKPRAAIIEALSFVGVEVKN